MTIQGLPNSNCPPPQQMESNPVVAHRRNEEAQDCDRKMQECLAKCIIGMATCTKPSQVDLSIRVLSEDESILAETQRRAVTIPVFPFAGNCCCIVVDVATLCHGCSGSIACEMRPTRYDSCCPSLLPPYLIGYGDDTCCYVPTACCDCPDQEFRSRAAIGFKSGELIGSQAVDSNRRFLREQEDGARRDPHFISGTD